MGWITRGPFWEDNHHNNENNWLEVNGEIVTENAVGEAAICCFNGLKQELVSFDPSQWLYTPILVKWVRDDEVSNNINVANHWTLRSVQQSLAANPKPVASWNDVAADSMRRCTHLKFSTDSFKPLQGHPFSLCAADRIRELLNTLNQMKCCFNNDGGRNPEGHRLYQDHFTGDKAWFSDSSPGEKQKNRKELTFQHPDHTNEVLFCTWHGKVKSPQYRIHFSWPIVADKPLYIVYVGSKITKR